MSVLTIRIQSEFQRQKAILFFKNFGAHQVSWLNFFITTAFCTGVATVVLSLLSTFYFLGKEKSVQGEE